MNQFKITLFFSLIFYSYIANAQKIFVTDNKYDAQLIVFISDDKFSAKDNSGLWYFTNDKYGADLRIFYINDKYDADIIVYYFLVQEKWQGNNCFSHRTRK